MLKDRINEWLSQSLPDLKEKVNWQWTGDGDFGDLTIVPAELTRLGLNPRTVHEVLFENKSTDLVNDVEFVNGFINITLSKDALQSEAGQIIAGLDDYLSTDSKNQTVVIDYSGPNIAKPFSVGHLRSTVIGQANYNIHQALGYKTIGINHIGDWGTQFGKLIYAIKRWGNEDTIAKNPIDELVALYQKFHVESEQDPALNEKAAEWFRKLELHDEEAHELWEKCISWSFEEFNRLYKVLGVKIDHTLGESQFADKTDEIVEILKEKGLLVESEGAQIVELANNMPPAIIVKSNESSLYMTRDLAALKYRIDKFNPDIIIYHVGSDQTLHFRQLFAVAEKLGWTEKTTLKFAPHGLMRLPEGKMSTRAGRVILLNDLIDEAKKRVLASEDERNESIKGDEQKIAVSAIKYADLATSRQSDVVFSFDRFIDLKGNSSIYLQYAYARTNSLIRQFKEKYPQSEINEEVSKEFNDLVRLGIRMPEVLNLAAIKSQPNILCDFVYKFTCAFNSCYEKVRIVTDDEHESAKNIAVVLFVQVILGKCLDLLGVEKLEKI